MVELADDHPINRLILELNVHTISLAVERQLDVDIVWVAGSQRSQTGESISVYPNKGYQKVNQKLVIHQTLYGERSFTLTSNLRVVESQRYVTPTILGECEVDLGSLIFDNHKSPMTVPLISKLDSNASLTFSVKVTNLVLNETLVSSLGSIPFSDKLSEYGRQAAPSEYSKRSLDMDELNTEAIYRKINQMATKLANIEDEIKSKTLKLNNIKHEGSDNMGGLRSSLYRQIKQKDKQIEILTIQLDELHTALALSHQRELEMGGYELKSSKVNKDAIFEDKGSMGSVCESNKHYYSGLYHMKRSSGKGSVSMRPESTHLNSILEHHVTGHYESNYGHNESASLMNGGTQRSIDHKKFYESTGRLDTHHGSEYSLNRRKPEMNVSVGNRLMHGHSTYKDEQGKQTGRTSTYPNEMLSGNENSYSEDTYISKAKFPTPSKPLKTANEMHLNDKTLPTGTGSTMVYRSRSKQLNSPGVASRRRTNRENTVQDVFNAPRNGNIQSNTQLKTPRTSGLHVGQTPHLKQKEQKPRASIQQTNRPQALQSKSAAVEHVQMNTPAGVPKSSLPKPTVRIERDNDIENRIVSLERDLITTKVALADSETQRDIEIALILNNGKSE